ncbi:MAG TPA: matrixin family metalloprotease [Solirubrobacterales bacterium]|nr:matrixin family metalloprotease [Solirubrobacterales bacterium]
MAQRLYDSGTRPRIFINWQSFVDQGMPVAWQWPFVDAVINAYTRWMTVAGVDLRFQFWNFTDRTESNDGELVISMNRRHSPNENRLASTFGSYNRLIIVFHRRASNDTTLWNFVPSNAQPGEIDMQGVLTHELGHCLGLDHSSSPDETMDPSYEYQRYRYGPFEGDVAAVKSLYPNFGNNRVGQLRSADGAGSWAFQPNSLTDSNHADARATITPGASRIGGSDYYLVGWTTPSRVPTWLRGSGSSFFFNEWTAYGGERSVQGPAYASDDAGRMLWAWVHNDAAGSIRMVGSTDRGRSWFWTGSPPGAGTAGTPALCWTRVGGQSTWICAWVNFERTSHERTGLVYASTSTDDGATWSAPVALHPTFKALGGASVAANPDNTVVVGFSLAPTGTTASMNWIQTFGCRVGAAGLERVQAESLAALTRIQPALAFDAGRNRFVLASREQNFLTTLATYWKGPAVADLWGGRVMLAQRSNTAPALASSPVRNESRLFYGYESVG